MDMFKWFSIYMVDWFVQVAIYTVKFSLTWTICAKFYHIFEIGYGDFMISIQTLLTYL